jgi:hypothetical protein
MLAYGKNVIQIFVEDPALDRASGSQNNVQQFKPACTICVAIAKWPGGSRL